MHKIADKWLSMSNAEGFSSSKLENLIKHSFLWSSFTSKWNCKEGRRSRGKESFYIASDCNTKRKSWNRHSTACSNRATFISSSGYDSLIPGHRNSRRAYVPQNVLQLASIQVLSVLQIFKQDFIWSIVHCWTSILAAFHASTKKRRAIS